MAYEKSGWQFDMNRAYTSASALDLTRYQLWYMAAVLTGNIGGITGSGLWTLYASSDSVTAGTDSTDRWVLAGPYDGTKIVRGASTAVHSWIVLRSPTIDSGYFYLTLSFNTSADTSIRVAASRNAPTSGSTTATPTGTNQWGFGSSGTVQDQVINTAAADAWRFSCGVATDGSFYIIDAKQTVGAQHCLFVWVCSNTKTADAIKAYTVHSTFDATASNCLKPSAGGVGVLNGGVNATSRGPDGSTIGYNLIGHLGLYMQTTVYGPTTWQSNSADSIDSTSAQDFPAWVLFRTALPNASGATGVRGRLADMGLNGPQVADYSVAPATGSVEFCKVGWLWLPANAAFIA